MVRYAVSVECLTCLENAQHGAKNVTSVAIKTTSVHSVSQEPGTESSAAHPEDTRAKVSHIIPGLEASRQPKVPTAWSQPSFKTIQMTSMEKVQTSMETIPFKTIWETTMETKKAVTSALTRILSRPFTRNQVKVSFQDHPPNVPKMDPNLVLSRPSSLKTCKKRVLSRPLRMDPKMTLLSRPWVKKAKNQLLSRPLQIELKTLTPKTWSLLMR